MARDVFGIVGTTVAGAFQVEAVVAEGGFAVVYRAHHVGFRAPVALKCLKIPHYLDAEQQRAFHEQFQAEAELLFKLSASIVHIVRPLQVEVVRAPDNTYMPFLALEWLDGETLEAHVDRRIAAGKGPPSLGEMLDMLAPVARALERAHSFNGPGGPISIVHRDMKPENVFLARVSGEPVVKILDFGIASARTWASQVGNGNAPAISGSFTPAYGAPEQWLPHELGHTGPWTDVWGLALTLVEALSGEAAFDGEVGDMMLAILDKNRRPTPRALGAAVSDQVEAVFRKALEVTPRDRYHRIGEFWGDLVRAHEGSAATKSIRGPFEEPSRTSDRVTSSRRPARRASLDSGAGITAVPEEASEPVVLSERSGPASRDRAPISMRGASVSERLAPSVPGQRLDSGRTPLWSNSGSASMPFPRRNSALSGVRRFVFPGVLIGSAVLITLASGAYTAASGTVLHVGPLRPGWIAGSLVLVGIGLLVLRLMAADE